MTRRSLIYLLITVFRLDSEELAGFYAMGDTPYAIEDHALLIAQIQNLSLNNALFAVHLGDIKTGSSKCDESVYYRVAEHLRTSKLPMFVLVGDNEWNDCENPKTAWDFWTNHFLHFDLHWDNPFSIRRDPDRNELFAFLHNSVLFVGVTLVGGKVHDHLEWSQRHADCSAWINSNIVNYNGQFQRLIVLSHATPTSMHGDFFDTLSQSANTIDKPVLYIHGDGHKWIQDYPFRSKRILRVQVDQGGIAPPVRISITDNLKTPFIFDRRKH